MRRGEKAATRDVTLRVAVVGSGPAGMYTAQHLLASGIGGTYVGGRTAPLTGRRIEVDMFDRLPTPYGLIRSGVAPDHPDKKLINHLFDSVASRPGFRFRGNVDVGRDITVNELRNLYDAVVYCVGAADDSALGIPGEDLRGSLSARAFVGWYNGDPAHAHLDVPLQTERAVIIGNGNVALDIARVLALGPAELARTDIAEHALAALAGSEIREIVVVGRRSHLSASFANAELEELAHLPGVGVEVRAEEMAHVGAVPESGPIRRKHDSLLGYAASDSSVAGRRITLRFLAAPTEIVDDGENSGTVAGIRLVHNTIVGVDGGRESVASTESTEEIAAGLVVRAIGFRGTPVPGLPFDDARAVVPNTHGRVEGLDTTYVAGWIKRGPVGVIGTNKKCARDTVLTLLADVDRGAVVPTTDRDAIDAFLAERCPMATDLNGWLGIDLRERVDGRDGDRPRRKIVDPAELVRTARSARSSGPRRFDAIVIGSGLGGLSTAACLAASGKKVLILEQHEILGGCSQVFRRNDKWEFDCGVHYVGGCVPGSDDMIPAVLRGLGVEDRIEWSRLDDDGMDTVSFPDHTFRVPTDWGRFADSLATTFPADADALRRCVAELRDIGEGFEYLNDVPHSVRVCLPLARKPRNLALVVRALELPIGRMFDRYGLSIEARGALLALVHLHNTPPSRTPALLVAALLQHYFKAGAYFPKQGGQVLAANLAEVIEANGGTIRTKARVKSIDVESGRVQGVTLVDGEVLRADVVVSNADVHRTFFDLIAPEHLSRRTLNRMHRFRRPHSIFSTYIAADIDIAATRPATNYILHGRYDVQETYNMLDRGEWDPKGWLAISSPTLKTWGEKHFGEPGHSSIEAFMAVPAEYEFWGGGDPMTGADYKWSPEYISRKAEVEDVVMERVLHTMPELDGHIVWQESASPLSHERYTLSRMPYGPENAKDQIGPGRRLSVTTEVDGLFLAGASTVYLYGIAFTLRGGVGTASHILGRDLLTAFRKGEVIGDVAALPEHGPDWDPFVVSRGHALKGAAREQHRMASAEQVADQRGVLSAAR